MSIVENLRKILASRYGKDVRQAIHDSIYDINEIATGARDSATSSAQAAATSATSAQTSKTQAENYAKDAKKYAEEAGKFTPAGYETLVSDVSTLKSSAETTATDISNLQQTDIVQNAHFVKVDKQLITNLLNPTLQSQVDSGVTITRNSDNSFTLNGQNNSSSTLYIIVQALNDLDLSKTYKLLGCPVGGGYGSYLLYNDEESGMADIGDGVICRFTKLPIFVLRIATGATLNNVVIKPMLTTNLQADYSQFVPYTGSTGKLNSDVAEIKKDLVHTNNDLSKLDVVLSKKMTVIDNAPLTQFNLFNTELHEEDCLREIFNTAPVGVPLIGKIFGGTQGIYYGHIYVGREYGSLALLRFNGEIKIFQRSFGNETIRTI